MDPNTLAPLIPVVAILAYGSVKVARIVTQARSNTQDPQTGARIATLEEEVATVQLEEGTNGSTLPNAFSHNSTPIA
jgi:hypothetical protein